MHQGSRQCLQSISHIKVLLFDDKHHELFQYKITFLLRFTGMSPVVGRSTWTRAAAWHEQRQIRKQTMQRLTYFVRRFLPGTRLGRDSRSRYRWGSMSRRLYMEMADRLWLQMKKAIKVIYFLITLPQLLLARAPLHTTHNVSHVPRTEVFENKIMWCDVMLQLKSRNFLKGDRKKATYVWGLHRTFLCSRRDTRTWTWRHHRRKSHRCHMDWRHSRRYLSRVYTSNRCHWSVNGSHNQ